MSVTSRFSARLARVGQELGGVDDVAVKKPLVSGVSTAGVLPREVYRDSACGGVVHRRRIRHAQSHCHGDEPVGSCLGASAERLATLALDQGLKDVDLRGALFVDTETTGLSLHGGAVPFLVGLSWFEDRTVCVEQMFLRALAEEAALLRHVAERLREATCLVSFNGKSFDLPLLRTRFIMNRVPMPPLPPHVDLLHVTRRVFRRRLLRVPLTRLEAAVLGFRRVDDVAGEEIPARYFDFLHRGRARELEPVFSHNEWDLLALPALLGRTVRHFESVQEEDAAEDMLGYASIAERGKDHGRALDFSEAAAQRFDRPSLWASDWDPWIEALLLKARSCRRLGDRTGELDALRTADHYGRGSEALRGEVNLALAKCLEHRFGDHASALVHAMQTGAVEGCSASKQRADRLKQRLRRRLQSQLISVRQRSSMQVEGRDLHGPRSSCHGSRRAESRRVSQDALAGTPGHSAHHR